LTAAQDEKPEETSRQDYLYWQRVTTRWADNDVYGHVNNAVYFNYIDSVVNQFLIENSLLDIKDSPTIGLVVQSQCRFFHPLAYPGQVDCGLRVRHLGTTSVGYEVGMFAEDIEAAAAIGGFTHVFVDRQQRRPCPVPDRVRKALQALI
jgi:acyl-CoA thioester hydrolase